MFNGIIFNTGTVKAIKKNKKSRVLSIFTKIPISKKARSLNVAVAATISSVEALRQIKKI